MSKRKNEGETMLLFKKFCRRFVFSGVSLFLVLDVSAGEQTLPVQQAMEEIQERLNKKIRPDWMTPGVSIGIFYNGQLFFMNSGVQDAKNPTPVTENTIFTIMSCTKIVTVLTIHKLVEAGLLSLDDKVVDHLPWFALSDPQETQKVQVKHLLAHCMGLPPFSADTFWNLGCSQGEIFDALKKIEMKHKVGETYGYQNMFIAIAGVLIEKVTGKPLDTVVRQYIFDPLDMRSSSIGPHPSGFWYRIKSFFIKPDPRHDPKRLSKGHIHLNGHIEPVESDEPYIIKGSAGCNSCTADYVKLVACLANKGVIQFGPHKGERLISEATWEWISGPKSPVKSIRESNVQFPVKRIQKGSLYYGNGMFGMDYGVDKNWIHLLYHMGAGACWRSNWCAVPESNFGAVLFSNLGSVSTSMLPESTMFQMIDLVFQFPFWDWHQDIFQKYQQERKFLKTQYDSFILGSAPDFELLSGTFEHPLYGKATLKQNPVGELVLGFMGRQVPLQHIGGTLFSFCPHDLSNHFGDDDVGRLTFNRDNAGNYVSFDLPILREGQGEFRNVLFKNNTESEDLDEAA